MQTVSGKTKTFHFVSISPKTPKKQLRYTGTGIELPVPVKTTAQITPAPYGWDTTAPGGPANQLFNAAVILLGILALIKLLNRPSANRSAVRDTQSARQ